MWKHLLDHIDVHPWRTKAAAVTVLGLSSVPTIDTMLKFFQMMGAFFVSVGVGITIYRKLFGKRRLKKPVIELLLIDDSEDDRRLFARVFSLAGCKVAVAGNMDEAIKIMRQDHRRIDLVLLDANMNGETTVSSFSRIKTERPLVPCAIFTGALNQTMVDSVNEISPGTGFFQKPHRVSEEFAKNVIDVLRIGVPQ